jgi:hypothetical protein
MQAVRAEYLGMVKGGSQAQAARVRASAREQDGEDEKQNNDDHDQGSFPHPVLGGQPSRV